MFFFFTGKVQYAVAKKGEGIEQNTFAGDVAQFGMNAQSIFPDVEQRFTVADKAVVRGDAQLIQNHVSSGAKKTDIHVSEILTRLDAEGLSGKGEENVTGLQGTDVAWGMKKSRTAADKMHFVYGLGMKSGIRLRNRFQNKMDGMDRMIILVIGDELTNVLIHDGTSCCCNYSIEGKEVQCNLTIFCEYVEIIRCRVDAGVLYSSQLNRGGNNHG